MDGRSREDLIEKIIGLRYACHEVASQTETVKAEIACLHEERDALAKLLDCLKSKLDETSRQRAKKIADDAVVAVAVAAAAAPPELLDDLPDVPNETDDRPGVYKTLIKIRVSDRCSLGGAVVANLPKDSMIRVIEVVVMPDIRRVRARIQEPEGWISLLSMEDGFRGVVRVAEVDRTFNNQPSSSGHLLVHEVGSKSDDPSSYSDVVDVDVNVDVGVDDPSGRVGDKCLETVVSFDEVCCPRSRVNLSTISSI